MHVAKLSFSLFLLSQHSQAISWEHVVLADCIASGSIRVSHMAYYSLGINSKPEAVTVVPTPRNKTAVWANRNRNSTSSDFVEATFPDGIFFRANLSTDRNLAGLGYNNFGTFNCWKYKVPHLYSWYRDVTCNAVYDCNHQAAPGDDESINATVISTTPDSSASAASTPRSEESKSNDIALGVGVGLGLPSIIVAIIGVLVARNKKAKQSSQSAATTNNGPASLQPGARVPNPGAASATIAPQGPSPVTQGSTPATQGSTPATQKSKAPQLMGSNRIGVAISQPTPKASNAASALNVPRGSSSVTLGFSSVTKGSSSVTQGSSSVTQGPSSVTQGPSSVARGPLSVIQGSSSVTHGSTPATQISTASHRTGSSNRTAIANPGPVVSKAGVTSAAIGPQGSSSITQGHTPAAQKAIIRN